MANKPSIPKGTRDFSPEEMVRRNYIFDTIRTVFKKYGYQPIETPAMEKTETLMGKYGEEGDRLIFRIFPRGEKVKQMAIAISNSAGVSNLFSNLFNGENLSVENMKTEDLDEFASLLTKDTTEEALRYDLTVPFARYVVQHQNEISFPFKRYQIQPVWRADRPQKGRYREFFQCDADVIGSDSLLNEVELVQMVEEVFSSLKVPVTIKINNRKILSGIAEIIGEKEKIVDITVAIDKLDKIGVDGVNKELREKNITEEAITKLQPLISFTGNFEEKINLLSQLLSSSEVGIKGVEEIKYVFATLNSLRPITNHQSPSTILELDITLARGLNYYTGAIFEVKANAGTLTSSITGGGRYDDLTGVFGLKNMSGVGISFGADRIYDVLNELNLYPESVTAGTRLLFANVEGGDEIELLQLLKKVREHGIASEIYPDQASYKKIAKQFKYADAKKIPFVAIIGENERKSGNIMLKNMQSGDQQPVTFEELIQKLEL